MDQTYSVENTGEPIVEEQGGEQLVRKKGFWAKLRTQKLLVILSVPFVLYMLLFSYAPMIGLLDFSEEKNHHFGILAFSDNVGTKVSNHITIRNCIITNAPSSGIQANGSDNILIENNTVFKNALKEDGNNGSGISVYEPKASPSEAEADDNEWGIVVRNNYLWQNNCLYPCPGFSFQTDGNGIIIDDYRWSQNGSKYPYTKETLVENNLIFDNGGRERILTPEIPVLSYIPKQDVRLHGAHVFAAIPACLSMLADSLRRGVPAETDGEDNLKTMRTVYAAISSAEQNGAAVKIL